jgi:isopenicillin-N epimerase
MMPDDADPTLSLPAADPGLWLLHPEAVFLNHGSFGSCPRAVLEFQNEVRQRLERQPVQFFLSDLERLLDAARGALAEFVGADPEDLVFVPNATAGVNTVLRSLAFAPGDELLTTDQAYNACLNALRFAAERAGARVVIAPVPFPLRAEQQITDAILGAVTARTRLALLDHITSPTGLVFPLARLVKELAARGVETLVDGAHAPGMVPLNLRGLGAAYYTGNCHKWTCAPKGAGFLFVRRDRQAAIRPLVISHGANSSRQDRSRFLLEFGWTGTNDPSAWLAVPEALRCVGALCPGGWPEVMRRNRALALAARRCLCARLNMPLPCPDPLIGSLAAVPLWEAAGTEPPKSPLYEDPLHDWLWAIHRIEVPVIPWPALPRRLLRVSAQLYNSLPQYERLAAALAEARSSSAPPTS